MYEPNVYSDFYVKVMTINVGKTSIVHVVVVYVCTYKYYSKPCLSSHIDNRDRIRKVNGVVNGKQITTQFSSVRWRTYIGHAILTFTMKVGQAICHTSRSKMFVLGYRYATLYAVDTSGYLCAFLTFTMNVGQTICHISRSKTFVLGNSYVTVYRAHLDN